MQPRPQLLKIEYSKAGHVSERGNQDGREKSLLKEGTVKGFYE